MNKWVVIGWIIATLILVAGVFVVFTDSEVGPIAFRVDDVTNNQYITNILYDEFGVRVIYTDEWYHLINYQGMKEFLENDTTDERIWIEEEHDCDNFAFNLYVNVTNIHGNVAFGVIFIEFPYKPLPYRHAMCFFIDENELVYIIEPQKDTITPWTIMKELCEPYFVLM